MSNTFNWVELPSTDFDRAVDFYSTILSRGIDVHEPPDDASNGNENGNGKAGLFQTDDGDVGGMIVESDAYTTASGASIPYTPTADSGPVVYLSVDGDLDDTLDRVDATGGEILAPKEPIPNEGGHYAIVTDTEGNRVGLMSTD